MKVSQSSKVSTSSFFVRFVVSQDGWEERTHADGRKFYVDHSELAFVFSTE